MTYPGLWRTTLVLAVLGLATQSSCAAGTLAPPEAQASVLPEPSEDLFPRGFPVVYPGQVDAEDRQLSSVMVVVGSSSKGVISSGCSGVLIHPRLVITAGHCVCARRAPTSGDAGSRDGGGTASGSARRAGQITRAATLKGVAITGIIDTRSPCAETVEVFTVSYASQQAQAQPQGQPQPYRGEVRVHPGLELVFGSRAEAPHVVWSNADLAAIVLEKPVPFELPRLELADAEVQIGDIITMVGFGPGSTSSKYGVRHFGENRVNRLIPLETGSAVFRAEEQQMPEGQTASHARQGDSGGACIKKSVRNVLVGIATVGAEKPTGESMSIFTSIYSHRSWLLQMLEKAGKS